MIDRIEEANMLEDKSISESKLPAEFKWICEKCLEGSRAHTCALRGIDGKLCPELSQLLKNWKQLSTELEATQSKLGCLLWHVTGGRFSKTSYTINEMKAFANDYQETQCDKCDQVADLKAENKRWRDIDEVQDKRIDEMEKQQKHGRWISVADRLPENEKLVLVSAIKVDYKGDKNNRISLAFHTDGNECSFNRKLDWEDGDVDLSWWEPVCHKDELAPLYGRVTHWMPLPESPKED